MSLPDSKLLSGETPRKRSKDRFFKQCLLTHVNTTQPLANEVIDYKSYQHHPIRQWCAYSGADRVLTSLISENP